MSVRDLSLGLPGEFWLGAWCGVSGTFMALVVLAILLNIGRKK